MESGPSRLQRELKQGKPFTSPCEEADVAILRTADSVRRLFNHVCQTRDLTIQQYNVLRILRGAGPKGLPTLEIVERLIEETPGITRLLDRLEGKDLVRRERCEEDRRQVFCRITRAGLKLLGELDGPVAKAHRCSVGDLSERETLALIKLLARVRDRHDASQKPRPPR